MTITTGAALAPEDDESRSLVVAGEVSGGISVTIAPDVVSDGVLSDGVAPGPDDPMVAVTALSTAETAPAPRVSLHNRLRFALPFTGPGLTGLGGVLLGCLVVGLGAVGNLTLADGLGKGFTVTFLLGAVLVAGAVRTRALAVAVVLPPLLFAGGYALETKASGQTAGRREMALDVATSLALHAPVLFVGTALAVAVALVRIVVHLVRR